MEYARDVAHHWSRPCGERLELREDPGAAHATQLRDLGKLAGENLLRVMAQTESVAAKLRLSRMPSQATIEALDAPGTQESR